MSESEWVRNAKERGYREALLDMYCFLTGNETILDIDPDHLARIMNMVDQVNLVGGRLGELDDSVSYAQ